MKPKKSRSVISILKSTNNYLLLAISLFIMVITLACATILYQSHRTVCELFNAKMETIGVNIARELALGEKSVATNLFENIIRSLKKVSSEVDINLKDGEADTPTFKCKAKITNAEISHALFFSGDRVGFIEGEIKSFNFYSILSFILFVIIFLFMTLKFVKNKLIQNIREQIVTPIELLCTQDSITLSEKAKQDLSNAEKISNIATQVAHDIGSPLEVLKSINSELELLPSDTKRIVRLSISRIEEIAFNLLKTHKQSMVLDQDNKSEELLSLVRGVVLEKKIEFRNRTFVDLSELYDTNSYGLFSVIQRNSLKNIISNLINNGVESIRNKPGQIAIKLNLINGYNVITIADSGDGIPNELQEKIFTKGFTTKSGGNGLGLYNTKLEIEAVGGTIGFESEIGKGTTFTIRLPKSETPSTFIDAIHAYKYDQIIVLDDDPAFHEVWNKRLEGLESKIEHIHTVEEMLSKYQVLNSKILLLSDFELMDKNYDGIDTILRLNHAADSILVTARSEEKAIQDRCVKSGIKLLAKSLVNYINILKSASEYSQTPIILIDDDRLVHVNWASHCKKVGLSFHGYKSIDEFILASSGFDKSSRIYIDSSLGEGIKGEIESEKIFNLGFINLFLATGYEKDSIERPSWIKEIFSKSPENILG